MQQRINIWLLIAVLLGTFNSAITLRCSGKQPNIILIMADDLGIEGLGCYGGTSYKTPELDKLASEGMRFTNAYAQPLCTNTRLQLMTGLSNHRNWLGFGILDPKAKTIGHYMQQAGYRTCMAGKWQLQSYDPPDYPGAAQRRGIGMQVDKAGFDEHCMWHTGHTEDKGSRYANPKIIENGKLRTDTTGRFGPDIWVEFVNDFVESHRDFVENHRDDQQPFFVYMPMALPHWPMVPTPDSAEWQDRKLRDQEDVRYIKDMVQYMDKCVGRVVANVDRLGLSKNTLIIFYSDNGTHRKVTSQTRQGPVVGGKGLTTDAGTHVPLIARWPGTIAAGVNEDLVDSTDFLPTLREAAEKPLPAEVKLDGKSFFPQLLGKLGEPREWVYCYFDPRPGWDKDQFSKKVFARDKRFKLYSSGELFDVPADQLEQRPIADSNQSAEVAAARKELAAVLKQMSQPLSD